MVLSIGEILVDIFVEGENEKVFPGGAPFNLASNIAHFNNKEVSFYGAVGKDSYGEFLKSFAVTKIGRLYLDELSDRYTTQAKVTLNNGERSFRFVRSNGSDYILSVDRLKEIDLSDINIVHIGSLMLSFKEGRDFFYEAVRYIKDHSEAKISFDVNYRDDIFSSEEEAKNVFLEAIKEADILKFTEEELAILSKKESIKESLESLLNGSQIAVVTLGKDGSIFYSKDKYIKVPTFELKPVDTTGAGDAFYSYILYRVSKGLDISNDKEIKECLLRANIIGGLATQKKGAIDVVPSLEEVEIFIKKHSK